ncbi:molybdopterin-dependent oxidoreductase [Extensimonas vulgaris]|jgi:DMSO/TMAO reductase YedYZ molybdopterin-dependent catalytic subunit|uniref:Sulfite dehydrogenase (Cytochrome) subunit SorA apoprotein n=1 Tax=Extensimonas vulgaris TaxID=1031594 RepID=A0A369ARL5_9BURK|nr:molybdopterin-dependent oxidoreductase [Extensimonas vulgaris]RCX12009.1 sulfite dehydrogenase (cytochrome) subunit SorA apoprotein [Extensimonas vulgaris]TWI38900.1 DMSO/TMAO reductase YedYZ molybdopterin-dependent catalytic subunit [Extensimonas vulgaris]TXD14998.1 molybdopterin-dependent oxidoreductase [Extensimonas vulgaris]
MQKLSRRQWLSATVGGIGLSALAGTAHAAKTVEMPFANGRRHLIAFPEKRELIVLTTRPPQLETPFSVFNEGLLTPNDAFFVRYHHNGLPPAIDGDKHVIKIGGNACGKPFELTMQALKTQFRPVELVAVKQCSGNSRAFFEPRVTGGQLGNGAMGNARWLGVPLKDILAQANVSGAARYVTFDGLDYPLMGGGDFVKALEIDHALDGEVMVAYQMNGADLPYLNGFPVVLVVPGYYGTYWIKHLSEIRIIDHEFDGFWMKTAYRIPNNDCACVDPGKTPPSTRPIGRMNVRSFITSLQDGEQIRAGAPLEVRGIAFDGGQGIREVAYSLDGGQNWRQARLGEDIGRYSFREFKFGFTPEKGSYDLRVRAWNRSGQSQPMQALWQPAGYMRNVVESVKVNAV